MGLPIVATDIRGCREVVQDGVTGRLVPVKDPGALSVAITEIADNEVLRGRMGEAGHLRARELFDERRCDAITRRSDGMVLVEA